MTPDTLKVQPPRRADFPADFAFGTATAAFQVEGTVKEDGRGVSIWDTFTHTPGRIADASTADVACNHYHRWENDLDLSELGVNAYRFSVSWTRVIPLGSGAVNPAGLDFYERLVDGMLTRGIQPYLTLYHWDLPQPLQDAGGWATRDTAHRFAEYAAVVAGQPGRQLRHPQRAVVQQHSQLPDRRPRAGPARSPGRPERRASPAARARRGDEGAARAEVRAAPGVRYRERLSPH